MNVFEDRVLPIYEEVKEELKIDPKEQLGSKERLDGIIARAGRG